LGADQPHRVWGGSSGQLVVPLLSKEYYFCESTHGEGGLAGGRGSGFTAISAPTVEPPETKPLGRRPGGGAADKQHLAVVVTTTNHHGSTMRRQLAGTKNLRSIFFFFPLHFQDIN